MRSNRASEVGTRHFGFSKTASNRMQGCSLHGVFFFSEHTKILHVNIFKRKECLIHAIISQTDLCQGKRGKIKTKTEKKEETTITAKHNSK